MANGLMAFTDYQGHQVRTDDAYKNSMAGNAADWNKQTGQNLSAQDYDKMLNPSTYGARWGAPADTQSTNAGTGVSTNTTGSTSIPDAGGNLPTAAQVTAGGLMAPTATAATAIGAGYNPNTSQINAPTDTVQGQIDALIAKNSPLMQRAEARSNDQMNSRGLMNSSMAVGAGQAALYDVALPIATTDANAYNATRFNNQTATNTASQFGAAAQNQASIANAQLSTDVSRFNADTAAKMAITQLQNSTDVAKFNASQSNDLIKLGMDAQTRTGLANIEAGYKQLLQSSAGASDMYKQAMGSIANILTNKDVTDKAGAMNSIMASLNDGLGIIGEISNLNLGSLLTFGNPAPSTPIPTQQASTNQLNPNNDR